MPRPLATETRDAVQDETLTIDQASQLLYWGAAIIGTVIPHFLDDSLRGTLNVLQHRLCVTVEYLQGSGSAVDIEDAAHLRTLGHALRAKLPPAPGPIVPTGTPAASRLFEAAAILGQCQRLVQHSAQQSTNPHRLSSTTTFLIASIDFLQELGRWHNFRHQVADQSVATPAWPEVPFLSPKIDLP